MSGEFLRGDGQKVGRLLKRLSESTIDERGRTQVPLVARRLLDLPKYTQLVWWLVGDNLVVAKLGVGTPNPSPVRGNSPSAL